MNQRGGDKAGFKAIIMMHLVELAGIARQSRAAVSGLLDEGCRRRRTIVPEPTYTLRFMSVVTLALKVCPATSRARRSLAARPSPTTWPSRSRTSHRHPTMSAPFTQTIASCCIGFP